MVPSLPCGHWHADDDDGGDDVANKINLVRITMVHDDKHWRSAMQGR